MSKSKKDDGTERVAELTNDLQRLRADFENYRKRVDTEKEMAKANGKIQAINALLPVVDNIERALAHKPAELAGNAWADGVEKLIKNLDGSLEKLELQKIPVKAGDQFNPELHDAIQYDEESDGETEVVAEVLQAGYTLKSIPIRHAMVRVTKR